MQLSSNMEIKLYVSDSDAKRILLAKGYVTETVTYYEDGGRSCPDWDGQIEIFYKPKDRPTELINRGGNQYSYHHYSLESVFRHEYEFAVINKLMSDETVIH